MKFVNFLKSRLICNIFYCCWMFVNKLFTYLTCAYLKEQKGFQCEIFHILRRYWQIFKSALVYLSHLSSKKKVSLDNILFNIFWVYKRKPLFWKHPRELEMNNLFVELFKKWLISLKLTNSLGCLLVIANSLQRHI